MNGYREEMFRAFCEGFGLIANRVVCLIAGHVPDPTGCWCLYCGKLRRGDQ